MTKVKQTTHESDQPRAVSSWWVGVFSIALMSIFFPQIHPTLAQTATVDTFTPEVPIPGAFSGAQEVNDSLLAHYIQAVYIYFIWVVGIVAVVMVMYGGIRWVGAAGNPGQIKEARDIIDSAVIGVIIALVSVVLLNIINPKLTSFRLPGLATTVKQYYDGAAVTTICPYDKNIDQNITCGDIVKTGSTKDRNGNNVDSYCMGVWCPYAVNGIPIVSSLIDKTFKERRVCGINQANDSKYYRPGSGCSATVPIASVSGQTRFDNVTQATVTNIPFNLSFGCGHVSPVGKIPGLSSNDGGTTYRFGYACRTSGIDFTETPMCYVVGDKAIITEAWVDGGQAGNAYCPPVK